MPTDEARAKLKRLLDLPSDQIVAGRSALVVETDTTKAPEDNAAEERRRAWRST